MADILKPYFTNEIVKSLENAGVSKQSMIKEEITKEDVVNLLNGMLSLDRDAFERLISYRVDCNQQLADHGTIQVGIFNGSPKVGIIGVINGLFGVDGEGYGAIVAYFDEAGNLGRFGLLERN